VLDRLGVTDLTSFDLAEQSIPSFADSAHK